MYFIIKKMGTTMEVFVSVVVIEKFVYFTASGGFQFSFNEIDYLNLCLLNSSAAMMFFTGALSTCIKHFGLLAKLNQ